MGRDGAHAEVNSDATQSLSQSASITAISSHDRETSRRWTRVAVWDMGG